MPDDASAKSKRVWDTCAPRYDRTMRWSERRLFGGGREWVCSRAHGDVLEVAVGTGSNLPLYPAGVRLTAVDLSPQMLAQARSRAAEVGLDARLLEGNAHALPFPDESFDSVVCTLSLCAIPDDRAAIGEMWRVLRPGGDLLLLDHIASSWWPLWAMQRVVEWFTIRSANEHYTRRPLPLVVAAGFDVQQTERLKLGTIERLAARKPTAR
jgi:ubiquinone/menaquinone biosynthesis C-methylase UbiE